MKDYMKQLSKVNDFVSEFSYYASDSSYICDIVSDMADDGVSIYTEAQIKYAFENTDAVEEAILNGIAPMGEDYFKQRGATFTEYCAVVGAAAWYEDNHSEICRYLKECIQYAVCKYLYNELDYQDIDDDMIDIIENIDPNKYDSFGMYLDEVKREIDYLNMADD